MDGLTTLQARERFASVGPNELPEPHREGLLHRTWRQLREPMSLLLLLAAAIAWFALGEPVDAIAIVAIVVVNAIVGVAQEGKAARALEALRKLETPHARVIRDGKTVELPARELVPDDALLLLAGDRVPADLRLVDAAALEVDESILTGESLPVEKHPGATPQGAALGDRKGELFSGTVVTHGSARGVVIATGPRTILGAIAGRLAPDSAPTPVQVQLRKLTFRLGAIAIVVAGLVAGLLVLRLGTSAQGIGESLLAGVAVAVAAVPEGLPTVVTVALALGVRRMAARGAIVRRLPAVETLGATTVILTDKTGTLTENRLALESALEANEHFERDSVLCNEATLEPRVGDPLELALLDPVGAERVAAIRAQHPLVDQIPFDSQRKRMTTLHRDGDAFLLIVKGAPEGLVDRPDLVEQINAAAARGMRTLAIAERRLSTRPRDLAAAEKDVELVGLALLRDPVRASAAQTIARARAAGVQVVMVTGDHAGTARWVAERVGIDGEHIRARVDPEDKLALVETLQQQGHVVAVTGDGVNDAPALRRADIGVAMGRSGSDVAREAANLVITDDDLATVVAAIREGRGIYDNIRKVVEYLVAGNLSEILVVVTALIAFPQLGVPLLPLQILWLNLLTDGLPALALGVHPVDPALMSRRPRGRHAPLLDARRFGVLASRAILIASVAILAFLIERRLGEPWTHARAMMFTVLVIGHLVYAFVVGRRGWNPWLVVAIGAGVALQFLITLWPPARSLFDMAPLLPREWLLAALGGTVPSLLMLAVRPLR